MFISNIAYVTGSNTLKAGFQWHIGQTWNMADTNGDLTERFRDGVPDSVIVYNTPTRLLRLMGADLGFYLQDSWTLKRLTISPGLRWEYFNSSDQAKAVEAGRFVPARDFPEIPNLPNWKNVAPRFSAVCDLTGDAKTAVKVSVNKLQPELHHRFREPLQPARAAERYAQLVRLRLPPGHVDLFEPWCCQPTETASRKRTKSARATTTGFGLTPARASGSRHQTSLRHRVLVSATRQVLPGVAVTGAWYRRDTYRHRAADQPARRRLRLCLVPRRPIPWAPAR